MAIYRTGNWWLERIGAIALTGGLAIVVGDRALAQSNIVPDDTLGAERSVITPNLFNGTVEVITGGAQREQNLFHSFRDFNVSQGREAYFFTFDAAIQNILARVTGGNPSEILGVLGTFGNSQPNLFLINPSGIIFGPNAQLNVAGSFVASTANSIVFENGFEFSATNPQAPPLLTINTPIGLQTGVNSGSLVNQSRANEVGLQVQPGKTLALVGGDIDIEAGILFAPDGRIELGSVAGNNRVTLTPTNTGYTAGYDGVENFQDIRLTQAALVTTFGNSGGSIQGQGRNVTLTDGSQITANVLGGGKGGGLSVNASESVQAIGSSVGGVLSGLFTQASASSTATGEAGDLTINTSRLLIRDGAQVSASTFGAGTGGNLTVNASDWVQVIGSSANDQYASNLSAIATQNSTGDAGNLSITTGQLLIQDGAEVSASTFSAGNAGNLIVNASDSVQVIGTSTNGAFFSILSAQGNRNSTGDAGDLRINTQRLFVSGGAQVDAATLGTGKGGSLTINASDSVQVIGISADGRWSSLLTAEAGQNSTGDAGDLTITTPKLLIQDGAQVSASTYGSAKGGNLTVNASEWVQVIGSSANGSFISNLSALAARNSTGDAGDLTITTGQLLIQDGGFISASTFGAGKGGSLTVEASDWIKAMGTLANGQSPSGLFVQAVGNLTGDGGELRITTGELLIRDGAQVSASTFGSGNGGNLIIDASEKVEVMGRSANGGSLSALGSQAESNSTGDAGDLTITTGQLLIQEGGFVSARTFGSGNGGNLIVNALDSVQVIGTAANGEFASSLTAGTVGTGEAGDLTINTSRLLVQDGAQVSASTFGSGKGGNLIIDASESVRAIGTSADGRFRSNLSAEASSIGEAGDLEITTGQLLIQNGAFVSASTYGSGKGGSVTVNASESVQVLGYSPNSRYGSALAAQAEGTNDAGDLRITTGQLLIQDGGFVSARTFGSGNAGNLIVNAFDSVQVSGTSADGLFPSGLFASTEVNSTGDAGDLRITTGQLLVRDGAVVSASTFGSGKGGNLIVNAAESVQAIGTSADGRFVIALGVQATPNSTGDAGDLSITTGQLLIQDGAQVSASTFGAGKGGNVTVNASEKVEVTGRSADGRWLSALGAQAERNSTGDAGDLTITTGELLIRDGAFVATNTFGSGKGGSLTINASESVQVIGTSADGLFSSNLSALAARNSTGDAGDLTITTGQLLIQDGAQVSASTFGSGNGGSLTVNASDWVRVIGTSADGRFFSGLQAQAERNSSGIAGDLTITTSQLLIDSGAQVSASTFSSGKGGSLTVNASDSVQVIGRSADARWSSLLTAQGAPNSTGDAGELRITTSDLLVRDEAEVSATAFGSGKGGNLTINAADSVQLSGAGGLFVDATTGGTAGSLIVKTGQLSIQDGSQVTVSSPRGQAGNLSIGANSLFLNRGSITAETAKSGAEGGANITIQVADAWLMRNESLISATAFGTANGGNINIDTQFLVALPPEGLEGSDIIANAQQGNGGRINITTQGIFGIEFRPERTPDNDITASSEIGLDGEVLINQPDVDPSRGLAQLPTNLVDAQGLIDRSCTPGGSALRSSFVVTGRGGISPSPLDPLDSNAIVSQWVTLDSEQENINNPNPAPNPTSTAPQRIVEAQGWVKSPNGQVMLVAQAPSVTPHTPWSTSPSCHTILDFGFRILD